MASQYGQTFLLEGIDTSATIKALGRVRFTRDAAEHALYDEAWIQTLIKNQPAILPVHQIEAVFEGLVSICTELPVASGFVDNLLITPEGNIALVECKLWRNPQARREVVAQIVDYAKDLSKWTYERLQDAICRSQPGGSDGRKSRSLYERVAAENEIDEADFVDTVSRNLRLGRFLLLIVGDGIQEGVESMAAYLQQHAGLHFTLGLVEIALFEIPGGGYIAQPRILARTINIERGIVTFEDSRIAINPPSGAVETSTTPARQMTITKEHYFEQLEKALPGISPKLNAFIDKLPSYGIKAEFGTKSLILRWHADDTTSWNLGTVIASGNMWLDYVSKRANQLGLLAFSKQYLARIAAIVPGAIVREFPNPAGWYVARDGGIIKVDALLENEARAEEWLHAIEEFQTAVMEARQVN